MSITIKIDLDSSQIEAIRELATIDKKKNPRNSLYIKNNEARLNVMRELAKLELVNINLSHNDGRDYVMEVTLTSLGYTAFDIIQKDDKKDNSRVKPDDYYQSYMAWAEVFSIFAKYEPEARSSVACYHDIIYAGHNSDIYSQEDKDRLQELHWTYDKTLECYKRNV